MWYTRLVNTVLVYKYSVFTAVSWMDAPDGTLLLLYTLNWGELLSKLFSTYACCYTSKCHDVLVNLYNILFLYTLQASLT